MYKFWILAFFLLFTVFVKGQSPSIETYDIVNFNMKNVTKTLDTTVQYVLYDTHGTAANLSAKVNLSFVREKLVAAQRIVESATIFDSYFFYFNSDQLIMVQIIRNGGADVYVCALPNCMFSKLDLSFANAIITSFGKMVHF